MDTVHKLGAASATPVIPVYLVFKVVDNSYWRCYGEISILLLRMESSHLSRQWFDVPVGLTEEGFLRRVVMTVLHAGGRFDDKHRCQRLTV